MVCKTMHAQESRVYGPCNTQIKLIASKSHVNPMFYAYTSKYIYILEVRLNIHKPTTYVGREKGYSYNPRDIHRPMSKLAVLFTTSKAASAAARSSSPPMNRAGRLARISFAAIMGMSFNADILCGVPRVLFHRS